MLEEKLDDAHVPLIAGGVQGRVPVLALHVHRHVGLGDQVHHQLLVPPMGAGCVEGRLCPDVFLYQAFFASRPP